MSVKALLTIEFEEEVTLIQQEVFNEKMVDSQWIKIPELKSTWEVSFNDFISRNFALNTAKADMTKATRKAHILTYSVAIQFGSNWPERFKSKSVSAEVHTS